MESTPVLLYDGECGVCARSVQFVLRHESPAAGARLRFAPLQGAFAATVLARHPALRSIESVIWFEPDTADGDDIVLVRSAAALRTLRYVGGAWGWLAMLGQWVPRVFRDALYRSIARERLRLAPPACVLPSADQRGRFLR